MSLGGASAPKPATFIPTNIGQVSNLATQFDTLGYNLSDQDFVSRFPGLVSQRNSTITDAFKQLTGPLDPTVQNSFANSSTANTLESFGGGTGSIGTKGSAARNAIGAGIVNQTNAKQDYDRQFFEQLIGQNPERTFGLGGGDQVNLLISNILGANQNRYAGYASNVSTSNASSAATTQDAFAAAQLAISAIGAIAL